MEPPDGQRSRGRSGSRWLIVIRRRADPLCRAPLRRAPGDAFAKYELHQSGRVLVSEVTWTRDGAALGSRTPEDAEPSPRRRPRRHRGPTTPS